MGGVNQSTSGRAQLQRDSGGSTTGAGLNLLGGKVAMDVCLVPIKVRNGESFKKEARVQYKRSFTTVGENLSFEISY